LRKELTTKKVDSDIFSTFENTEENLLGLYTRMLRIRKFEDRLVKLYQNGEVYGGNHSYQGEEAIASGACHALKEGDVVFSTHRGHGHALAKDVPSDKLFAELMARETGTNNGRGGSMHIYYKDTGFMGSNGMVGGGIGIATGAAYAFKYNNKPNVAVTFFGDGASNMGIFYESMNLASIWKLPVIFICENNRFATATPLRKTAANMEISSRALMFRMNSITVDGNNVMDVYEAVADARERAINGEGPTLIECKTYRHYGHYIGDLVHGVYRTKEEMNTYISSNDPVRRFREALIGAYGIEEEKVAAVEAAMDEEIEAAYQFAANSPFSDPANALKYEFAEEDM